MYHTYRITHPSTGQHWTQSNTTPEGALDQVLLFGSSDKNPHNFIVQEIHITGDVQAPPSTWVTTYSEPIELDLTQVVFFYQGFTITSEQAEKLGLLNK